MVLYVGHNIELAKTMFSLSNSGFLDIDHLTNVADIYSTLSSNIYTHFICELNIDNKLRLHIADSFPRLNCIYLNRIDSASHGVTLPFIDRVLTDEIKITLDALTIPIYLKSREGDYLACNQSYANLLGLTAKQVIGKKAGDILPKNLLHHVEEIDKKIFTERGVHFYEYTFDDTSGKPLNVCFRKEVVGDGEVQIGIVFDISDNIKTKKLLEQEQIMLRASADSSNDLIFFKDLQSRFLGCNKQFEKFVGASEEAIIGKTDEQLFAIEQALMCVKQDRHVMSTKEIYHGEEYLTYNDGVRHFIAMKKEPLLDKFGHVQGLIGIGRDITAHHLLEKQLKIANVVFENSNDSIFVTDANGIILSANQSSMRISGYARNELLSQHIHLLSSHLHNKTFYAEIAQALKTQRCWLGDITYQTKNGNIYYAWLEVHVVRHEQENMVNHVYSFTDLTQNKSAEEKIKYLSKHDPLTGLLNRIALFRRIEDVIARANYNESAVAVMLIKITSVKIINEQYGHNEGDSILKESAKRLKLCVGEKYTLARLWGDELVVIVDELENEQDVAFLAHEIAECFKSPYLIDNVEVSLSAMIGISIYPDDGYDADALLISAEKAMLRGRKDRTHAYHFYTETLTKYSKQQLDFEGELQQGLLLDQFELYYQPQYDLNKRQVVALESLLRWNHPKHGVLLPERFLMLAEERGMLVPIGLKMIRTAADQAVIWQKQNINFGRITINLSRIQLEQISFISDLQVILKESKCTSRCLEFEINEKIFNSDNYVVHENLINISKLGFALTVDNFGADISLIPLIEKLQIEKLKISKDYTKTMPGGIVAEAMIKSIMTLSHCLGIDLVSEGLDDVQQACFSSEPLIDTVQGNLQVKPMKANEATFYLRCNKRK